MSVPEDPHIHRAIRGLFRLCGVDNERLARKVIDYVNGHLSRSLKKQAVALNKCDVCGAVKKPGLK